MPGWRAHVRRNHCGSLGFEGELIVIGDERHAPYHRPPLSKKLLTGDVHRAGVDLAPQFDLDARVFRGASATGIDIATRTLCMVVTTAAKHPWASTALVIAVWCRAPDPSPPNRSPTECCRYGLSTTAWTFATDSTLGLGSRSSAGDSSARKSPRPAAPSDWTFALIEKSAGPVAVSCWARNWRMRWADLHREHGVDLHLGVGVDEIVGKRCVEAVRLTDGTRIAADLVVVGLGVVTSNRLARRLRTTNRGRYRLRCHRSRRGRN